MESIFCNVNQRVLIFIWYHFEFHFAISFFLSLKTGPVIFPLGLFEVTGPVGQQLFCMSPEH